MTLSFDSGKVLRDFRNRDFVFRLRQGDCGHSTPAIRLRDFVFRLRQGAVAIDFVTFDIVTLSFDSASFGKIDFGTFRTQIKKTHKFKNRPRKTGCSAGLLLLDTLVEASVSRQDGFTILRSKWTISGQA